VSDASDEAIHTAIVAVAALALVAVIGVSWFFARSGIRIVLYSSIYVAGVCAFWLGYWALKSRSEARRRELLEN